MVAKKNILRLFRLKPFSLIFGTCSLLSWCSQPLRRAGAEMDGRGVVTNVCDKILSHICLKKLLESYLVFDMLLLVIVDGV